MKTLTPWIKQVHIKDATASNVATEWGAEVSWGDGDVEDERFIQTLGEIDFSGTLVIEREASEARVGEIKRTVKRLGELK